MYLRIFDITIRAQDEQPPVAPGAEAVGREPVQPHIAEAAVAAQHHVAEVLELRMVGMAHVRDLRRRPPPPASIPCSTGTGPPGASRCRTECRRTARDPRTSPAGPPPPPASPPCWIIWCGAMLIVWITLPIAPCLTSSPAYTAAFTSSRSLYMMA